MRLQNGKVIITLQEAYDAVPEFKAYMDNYKDVFEVAKRMEGNISAYGCLSADTLIKVKLINDEEGWIRIDQLDSSVRVAYVNNHAQIQYTKNFYSHKTGRKKLYKMRLETGDYIKVTDEHLIFTNRGCVKFEKIRKNPEKYRIYRVDS